MRPALRSAVPALAWLPSWRAPFRRDALAALAVSAVLVPQSTACASLAGVPPVDGPLFEAGVTAFLAGAEASRR